MSRYNLWAQFVNFQRFDDNNIQVSGSETALTGVKTLFGGGYKCEMQKVNECETSDEGNICSIAS